MKEFCGMMFCCLLLSMVAGLTGCGTKPPTQSGFLDDYSRLAQSAGDKSMLEWYREDWDWKRYKKVMIDPLQLCLHPDSKSAKIPEEKLNELIKTFRQIVIDNVKEAYPVVEQPGPDVLRVRAAITDIQCVSPTLNVATMASIGVPLDMGGAAIETEFIDAASGEVIGMVVDGKKGTPIDLDLDAFDSTGHARGAFKEWAKELKLALDQMHQEPPAQ